MHHRSTTLSRITTRGRRGFWPLHRSTRRPARCAAAHPAHSAYSEHSTGRLGGRRKPSCFVQAWAGHPKLFVIDNRYTHASAHTGSHRPCSNLCAQWHPRRSHGWSLRRRTALDAEAALSRRCSKQCIVSPRSSDCRRLAPHLLPSSRQQTDNRPTSDNTYRHRQSSISLDTSGCNHHGMFVFPGFLMSWLTGQHG
jgi:hypothetical protein